MRRTLCQCGLISGIAMLTSPITGAFAAEAPTTQDIEVIEIAGHADRQWIQLKDDAATEYQLDHSSVDRLGAMGGGNAYYLMSTLPGVNSQSIDGYGQVNMYGGNKGMRVRGERATHGANGLLGGVPLNGPGPGPGYLFLLDNENIAGASLAQGPVAPDNANFFTSHGAQDTAILWPEQTFSLQGSYSYGDEHFHRAYGRVDTGTFFNNSRAMLSASTSTADKWRGSGQAPDYRNNVSVAWESQPGNWTSRLWLSHSDMAADDYRGLTYAQSRDLRHYYHYDYDAHPTGDSNAALTSWQGYNRQSFKSDAAIGELTYHLSALTQLQLRPFYLKEKGFYLRGLPDAGAAANPGQIRKWTLDHDNYGLVTRLQTTVSDTLLKLGHSWLSTEPPGPPTQWQHYAPTASGELLPLRYAKLAEVKKRHELHSAYLVAAHQFDELDIKAGLRYLHERLPKIDAYTSVSSALSYHDARRAAERDPSRSVSSRSLDEWLPYLGANYRLNEQWSFRLGLGRNAGAPALNVFNPVPPVGMTSQQLWDKIAIETSDAIDIGATFHTPQVVIAPTLYYAHYKNKGVNVYDPALQSSYTQNIAKANQWGAQLLVNWQPWETLELFGNASWTRSEFDGDFQTTANSEIAADGRQLPDVPKLTGNVGLLWQYGPWQVSPTLQYMSKRYADVQHTEHVSSYTATNLAISYQSPQWSAVSLSLAVVNLFDRKYISFISSDELSSPGQTTFYPAAPRTVMGKISFCF